MAQNKNKPEDIKKQGNEKTFEQMLHERHQEEFRDIAFRNEELAQQEFTKEQRQQAAKNYASDQQLEALSRDPAYAPTSDTQEGVAVSGDQGFSAEKSLDLGKQGAGISMTPAGHLSIGKGQLAKVLKAVNRGKSPAAQLLHGQGYAVVNHQAAKRMLKPTHSARRQLKSVAQMRMHPKHRSNSVKVIQATEKLTLDLTRVANREPLGAGMFAEAFLLVQHGKEQAAIQAIKSALSGMTSSETAAWTQQAGDWIKNNGVFSSPKQVLRAPRPDFGDQNDEKSDLRSR